MRLRKEFLHRIHLRIFSGWDFLGFFQWKSPEFHGKTGDPGGKKNHPETAQEKAQNPIHTQGFNSDFRTN